MLERDRRDSRTENTFVLPADTPPGPVSVVSDFNERKPGTHELTPTRRNPRRHGRPALRGQPLIPLPRGRLLLVQQRPR